MNLQGMFNSCFVPIVSSLQISFLFAVLIVAGSTCTVVPVSMALPGASASRSGCQIQS